MQSNPKVSVIMPVYNAAEYLREAMDSIISQTLDDIEIICVDDGSTDKSLKILKEYSSKDKRITILEQSNQGAGVARNFGISIARGKYFSFLDADDIFMPDLLDSAYKVAEENNSDIVVYRFARYDTFTHKLEHADYGFQDEYWKEKTFNLKANPDKIYNSFNPCAWNKLFKAKFIEDNAIVFQSNKRTNDLRFTSVAMACADRITKLDKVLVHYRVGMKSNSQATNDLAPLDFYKALSSLKDILIEKGIYAETKKSYMQLVEDVCLHNLRNNSDGGLTVYRFLREQGFRNLEFNISDYPKLQKKLDEYYPYDFLDRLEQSQKTEILDVVGGNDVGDNIKVSVIVPVYNVKDYLAECLDSLINQSLEEIEIICVNDGSTDGSLDMLLEYTKKDGRIIVISERNGGLSVARNTGLAHAKGEYVYFLDSDDKITLDALENLYYKSVNDSLDLLLFDGESFFESKDVEKVQSGYKNYYKRFFDYRKCITGKDLFVKMVENNEYRTSVVLCFYRKSFLTESEFSFISGILHEDIEFTYKVMLKAGNAAHIPRAFYLRRVRNDSIVSSQKKFAHLYGHYVSVMKMQRIKKRYNFEKNVAKCCDSVISRVIYDGKQIIKNLDDKEKYVIKALDKNTVKNIELIFGSLNFSSIDNKSDDTLISKVLESYHENGLIPTIRKIYQKVRRGL